MYEDKTEGIVLRSQDFKERHRIITLFSPQGLISLIVRGISRKNARLLALTTPFCNAEYHFRRGHSDLLSFRDGAVIDEHLDLRTSLASLTTAGTFANLLLRTQFPGKPAPVLYALYKSYHRQVVHFPDPSPLVSSFYLKFLEHEGLLSLSPTCALCANAPARLLDDGESRCAMHATQTAFDFTPEEWTLLLTLHTAQHFSPLRSLPLSPSFCHKIASLTQRALT